MKKIDEVKDGLVFSINKHAIDLEQGYLEFLFNILNPYGIDETNVEEYVKCGKLTLIAHKVDLYSNPPIDKLTSIILDKKEICKFTTVCTLEFDENFKMFKNKVSYKIIR